MNLTARERREAHIFSLLLIAGGLILGLLTLNEYLTFGAIDGGATPLWLAVLVWTALPCLLGFCLTSLLDSLKAWEMAKIRNARWLRVQQRREAEREQFLLDTLGVPFRPEPVRSRSTAPRGSRRY